MNPIFIPKELHVGFQERLDTYTGQLAYIIYKDEKGTLRKEKSWNNWKDENIEPLITENEPLSGFVLNKKAGGYSTGWNHRQTYVRVYDPRNFEIEITIENLLYILENTSSIKGKGLEGEFVYGWDGKDLILIPTSSPDYKEIEEYNKLIYQEDKIKAKDLKVGVTYLTKQNQEFIYLGKFDYYSYNGNKNGKKHFFGQVLGKHLYIETVANIQSKILKSINDNKISPHLGKLMEELELNTNYSPIAKSDFIKYSKEELESFLEKHTYLNVFDKDGSRICLKLEKYPHSWNFGKFEVEYLDTNHLIKSKRKIFNSIEEVLEKYDLYYETKYQKNGVEYSSTNPYINKLISEKRKILINEDEVDYE